MITNISNNGRKRAVLYARVSTDEQKETGYGLIGQIDECRDYATRSGFEIVKEFQDDYTGFSPFAERPSGKQLMEMVKAHQVDAVIAHRVDRIARDSLEARIAARMWLKSGLELHTVKNGQIKNDNDIVFLIETWQGQEDYTKIIVNLKNGRSNKARSGNVVGCNRAPYGYRFTRNDKGTVIGFKVAEATGRIVRLIFHWYVYGDDKTGKPLTLWAIGSRLNAMQIPTPGQLRAETVRPEKRGIVRKNPRTQKMVIMRGVWSSTSIKNILTHEAYAGVWRYGRIIGRTKKTGMRPLHEQIPVNVPAIVDRETWERAQTQRRINAAESQRNRKHEYLLTGFIQCSCGRSQTGFFSLKRRYRCTSINYHNRLDDIACNETTIIADDVEKIVWDSIKEKFGDLNAFRDELEEAQARELTALDPKREELGTVETWIVEAEQEVNEIAMGLRRARGRVLEGLEHQQDQVNARLDELHTRREKLIVALGARSLTDEAIGDLMQYAEDVRLGVEHATFEEKRKTLRALQVRVVIKSGKVMAINGVIEFNTQCNTSAS